ncbi:MAG: FeoB-associated Cys-rich membrane protein [Desulfobacteraceae bacterium]|nr:FeoB-associated Cys-rich membrane protein [Desulfobacteraceae bacterium]
MQTAIVIIIVALAAFFLLRNLYLRLFKRTEPACGCGCSGCAVQHECHDPRNSTTP